MARRFGPATSMANVQTIEATISNIGRPFAPKSDPFRELSDEIEKCRKQIWHCAGDIDPPQRQAKKAKMTPSMDASTSSSVRSVAQIKGYNSSNGQKRADIEFKVNAMKVAQMRDECRKLGLDTKGVKTALRSRLLTHLLEEQVQPGDSGEVGTTSPMKVDPEPEPIVAPRPVSSNMDETSSVVDTTSMKSEVVFEQPVSKPARVSNNSAQADSIISSESVASENRVEKAAQDTQDPVRNNTGKPETDTRMKPEPIAKSPLRGLVKEALKAIDNSVRSIKSTATEDKTTASDITDDISPPASEVTTGSSSSKISGSRVRELVSKLSSQSQYSSNGQTGNTPSALSQSVQAKKEARMARMAEIRGKSQQAKAAAPKEFTPSMSSLNANAGGTTGSKKNLAAQMREKALRKENNNVNQPLTSSSMIAKNNFPLAHALVPDGLGSTLKNGLGTTLKYGLSASKAAKPATPPMDTYEISDREDSDTDDSDSEAENEKKKKKIPTWAKKENLLPALEEQYLGCVDGRRVDPDELFPEVETCDLEAIFGANKKNAKYRSRTSSGNWSRDQVTAAEKLVYKRAMGFAIETSEI